MTEHTGWRRLAGAGLAVMAALGACDDIARKELKPGVSTVADVRRLMGRPEMVWEAEDGSQTLEFVRGPEGHTTWMVSIGSDGTYRGMTNVLVPEVFARVKVGDSRDDVRRLLGKPTEQVHYALSKDEVWTWRHLADGQRSRLFHVSFGTDGRVRKAEYGPDALKEHTGG